MRHILTLAAVAACGLLLSSCQTLNEDQCVAGDWAGIGYTDGANGHPESRFGDHVKACSKYNIVPDQAVYRQGRVRGLPVYCNPNRGFSEGRQGRTYAGVCPASLERGFLGGYNDGRVVWDAAQRVSRAESEISNAQYRWNDVDEKIREEERRLDDAATPNDQKGAIRERLKRLRDDRRTADNDLRDARYRRDEAEREVNQLRYRFSPTYGSW